MVDKKKMVNKSELLAISLVLIAVGFMVFVLAATTTNSPIANGNYSGTLVFNCTTALPAALNASLLYNVSGGAATTYLVTVTNTSASQTEFYNGSVIITSLSDAAIYNMTCLASNGTDEYSTAVGSITIDNTAPNVSFSGITNTVDSGSYKSSIVVNVSVVDATIGMTRGSVYFNITNSTGDQHNFTQASVSGDYYNITVDTTKFTDGVYNITVYSNDSLNNLNNTEVISVTFDDTVPSAVTLTSSSATTTSLTITIGITDATAGMNQSCTTDRSGASFSGTTNSQTLTETGLSCGTTYQYLVHCNDAAGNGAYSAQTSFTTTACTSGGSSSGGISPPLWSQTYSISDEQFKAGYTKEIAVKNRVKVKVGNTYHHVGVKEVTVTSATIEIASDPVEVKLDIGEEAKVDVTDDDYYDIYVKLLGIINGKANIIVQEIHEEIPEGVETGEGVETTGEIIEGDIDGTEESSLTWLWIVIGIIVLAVIIGGGIAVKKKGQ